MEIIELIGKKLYQWDTGRQVRINPPKDITVDEMHFAGKGDTVALVVLPKSTEQGLIADIPNILLQRSDGIRMWSVTRYSDGSERTVSSAGETIIQRAKPEDYVYTETEVLRYENLEKRIENLEKNGGGGTADAAQQPDWSQNDETQPDHVKNRTHWYEDVGAVVLEETTIAIDDEAMGIIETSLSLIAGKTYIVKYNGTSYTCVASEDENAIYLGNVGLAMDGISSGEPFVFGYFSIEGMGALFTLDGTVSADVTLSIAEGAMYHTLDNRYLDFIYRLKGDSFVWDGDTSKLEKLPFSNAMFKFSDKVPSLIELQKGGSITYTFTDGSKKVVEFTAENVLVEDVLTGKVYAVEITLLFNGGSSVTYQPLLFLPQYLGDELDGIIPKGSYLTHTVENNYYISEITLNGLSFAEEKIKEEYLPSSIARQAETVPNPSTGAVGQILEIESVDENGKPLTYKAVNKSSNKKLTFTGAVTAEYDGSGAVTVTIPESGTVERIEKLSTDTEVELQSNKLYIFPEMESLSVTFAEPSRTDIVNEYHIVFQSGETATALTLPDTVNVPESFTIDANKIYEISIMEKCLAYQSWEVTA